MFLMTFLFFHHFKDVIRFFLASIVSGEKSAYPVQFLLHMFFRFKISTWFFLLNISVFLLTMTILVFSFFLFFYFSSIIFTVWLWSLVIVAVLKSLSGNSNTWVILGLTSVDCFVLKNWSDFSVFIMLSNFGLYPGYFEYYVAHFWVLLKSSGECLLLLFVLAGNSPIRFRLGVLAHILWAVNPVSIQFSTFLLCCLGLPCTCAT